MEPSLASTSDYHRPSISPSGFAVCVYLAHDTLQFFFWCGQKPKPFQILLSFLQGIQAEASLRAHMTQATQSQSHG